MGRNKGFAPVIILVVVATILIGVYFFYTKVLVKKFPGLSTNKEPEVQLKTEYKNPFDKKTQYVNPFAQNKNPLDATR